MTKLRRIFIYVVISFLTSFHFAIADTFPLDYVPFPGGALETPTIYMFNALAIMLAWSLFMYAIFFLMVGMIFFGIAKVWKSILKLASI